MKGTGKFWETRETRHSPRRSGKFLHLSSKFPRFSVFSYLLDKFYTFNSDRFEDVFYYGCLTVAVPYTIFRPKTILFHLFLKFLKVYHGLPLFLHSKKAEKNDNFPNISSYSDILVRYCNPRFDPNFKIMTIFFDLLGNLLASGRRQDF